jgi:Spy/CpxP family protein refolding chaperone
MDIFTQKKLLVRIVIILAVLNIALMGIFLWRDVFHRPSPPVKVNEARDLTRVLQRELKLTREQTEEIRKLRDDFSRKENEIEIAMKAERDSMNNMMFRIGTDDVMVKSIARRISENGFRMEMLRIEQAKAIKAVCNDEQLQKFESLVRELRDYLQPQNKPRQNDRPERENKPKKERGPKGNTRPERK